VSPAAPVRVLVLEDDPALCEVMCEGLGLRGHTAVAASSVAEALEHLTTMVFDVALLDLNLPDGTGIDVLRHLATEGIPTEGIVLTGNAALETAIEAMKLGAYDYLAKPVRMGELEVLVEKAAEKASLRRENHALRNRLQRLSTPQGIVTEDPAMKALLASLERVAVADLPVLIQGESGTGKELLARALFERSDRASQAFITVNCAAMPESLLESELFGHEKGAFTGALLRKPGLFELADRGMLVLDEIGEIAPSVQAKLLRAVETCEFYRVGGTRAVRSDVRVVAATNKDLRKAAQTGTFREDLYFRLNGVTLTLPPLRERKGDIPLLARHFLDRFAGRKRGISRDALDKLGTYSWPGNVRELQMVVRRAAVLSPREVLEPEDLLIDVHEDKPKAGQPAGLTLAEMEREYIESVLKDNHGHRGKTAQALGIDVKTLYNKLGPQRKQEG
jgi:two-component system response regulator AtoC